MPISLSPQMMREIIMDHYNNPINKSTPKDISKYKSIRMDSTTCIDDITIYILVENDVIKDAKFDGVGCTISTASTDIMCELIKNKTIKEADYIFEQYNNMIFEKEFDKEALDEALVFVNTSKQAARIKCATIGWNGMQKCLHGEKDEK